MLKSSAAHQMQVQAFLLADHIYRDEGSGKYIIAGAFYQIHLPSFPTTLNRSIGLFVSLYNMVGTALCSVQFVEEQSGTILMQMSSFELTCPDPYHHVEFAIEIPPLPLPEPGRYAFHLLINDEVICKNVLSVNALEEIGTSS